MQWISTATAQELTSATFGGLTWAITIGSVGSAVAFDPRTGDQVYSTTPGGSLLFPPIPPVVDAGRVYVTTSTGAVVRPRLPGRAAPMSRPGFGLRTPRTGQHRCDFRW